jgi:Flp pilus assembly protein TadG
MTQRTLRNGKGSSLVEFAMVFPLLMVLIFAVMDFGVYFFIQHSMQFATREGVRLALVGRTIADPNNPSTQLSREASIAQMIRSKASVAVRPADVSVYVFPVDATFTDPSGWQTAAPNAGLAGSYMRVKTRYTYQLITPLALVGFILPSKLRVIEVQATYRNELFN